MNYFKSQEEAKQLFNKLSEVSKDHNVIMIVVRNKVEVVQLKADLQILLQRFPMVTAFNRIRIKGTSSRPAQTLVIVGEDDRQSIVGVPKETVIWIKDLKEEAQKRVGENKIQIENNVQ